MAQRVFISFDYDNDARLKDLLVGQSKHSDSPFAISDWSIKEPSADWKDRARARIRAAGLVIVLCGKDMGSATGVAVEVAIAQEEGVPYFLLAGFSEGSTRPTTAKPNDKLYSWTWDNLKALVGGAR
ncbi:TIR domain-containing protein [Clavibacter michiganensis]|uniref:TIR domain-containing protein n=1 Tax=Clavibacter michiganensis TaxID=28447 RepID=UPI002930DEE6|nr:TIR domain-containing protein [Clavibacter michiganensis]